MPPDSLGPSLALLTQLADHAGDALLAFDRELRCVYANRAARRLAGFGDAAGDDARRWIGASAEEAFAFVPIAPLRQALEGQSSSSRGAPVPGTRRTGVALLRRPVLPAARRGRASVWAWPR